MSLKIYRLPHPTNLFYVSIEAFFLLLIGTNFSGCVSSGGFGARYSLVLQGLSHAGLQIGYFTNLTLNVK